MKIIVGIEAWGDPGLQEPTWSVTKVLDSDYDDPGFMKELKKVMDGMLKYETEVYPRKVCAKCNGKL